ncbi:helix-turn-helix transcriptional regulator [Aestuariispira insulae]|uniref:Uncharacterized protein n=1 Tax=Aestuariispira insulae TaxID=1461337 RepID=A0A3D9HW33_9PROT|nr:hypothetical protein [Aestuariispira insulae]RED53702.1 hypothetical protein DFP90_101496 [Aestuariispira insulae]
MQGSLEIAKELYDAASPNDIFKCLRRLGVTRLAWIYYTEETLQVWQDGQDTFFDQYFELEADMFCAVAWAVRRRWGTATFHDMRSQLSKFWRDEMDREAERFWENGGVVDGIMLYSGKGRQPATVIMATAQPADSILETYWAELHLAAALLFRLLEHSDSMREYPRFMDAQLTYDQLKLFNLVVRHPQMTVKEQAEALGISEASLKSRQIKIMKKLNVKTWGAVFSKMLTSGLGRQWY